MSLVANLEGFVIAQFNFFKTLASIIALETRLAGLSVYPLLCHTVMLLVILMSLWSSVLLSIGYALFTLYHHLALSLLASLLLNVILFFICRRCLLSNLRAMSFETTRACLFKKENNHDTVQETIDSKDCQGEKLSDSTAKK